MVEHFLWNIHIPLKLKCFYGWNWTTKYWHGTIYIRGVFLALAFAAYAWSILKMSLIFFFLCLFINYFWSKVYSIFSLQVQWNGCNLEDVLKNWCRLNVFYKDLLFLSYGKSRRWEIRCYLRSVSLQFILLVFKFLLM